MLIPKVRKAKASKELKKEISHDKSMFSLENEYTVNNLP